MSNTTSVSHTAPSLIDIGETFLPLAPMRQISRVTALEGPVITGDRKSVV